MSDEQEGLNAMELRDFKILQGLSDADIERLVRHIHIRHYGKRTQIISEGEPAHCLYFVLSGRVKVYLDDEKGKEITVNFHEEGEVFGELSLIQGIDRTASVVTVDDCRLGLMSDIDFRQCMQDVPAFNQNIMNDLIDRLKQATEIIRRLGLMDVYGRIAVLLLNESVEQDGIRVMKEKLTQQNIASRVGSSREMVARILKDLRIGGYVDANDDGFLVIHKPLPHSW